MRTARVEGDGATSFVLSVLAERLAVCRMTPAAEQLPVGATMGSFCSITRTTDELSVICPEGDVPDGVMCERLASAEARRFVRLFVDRHPRLGCGAARGGGGEYLCGFDI